MAGHPLWGHWMELAAIALPIPSHARRSVCPRLTALFCNANCDCCAKQLALELERRSLALLPGPGTQQPGARKQQSAWEGTRAQGTGQEANLLKSRASAKQSPALDCQQPLQAMQQPTCCPLLQSEDAALTPFDPQCLGRALASLPDRKRCVVLMLCCSALWD